VVVPVLAAYAGNFGRSYVVGELSDYGILPSQEGTDLPLAHIAGNELPGYARAMVEQYEEALYGALLDNRYVTTGKL
jgi:hypothetical protein